MNTRRVILGGLLAGLVLNVGEAVLHGFLLAGQTAAAMTALGKDPNGGALGLTLLILVTFAQGLVGMWLYAAVCGRSKSKTLAAIGIGTAVWLLSVLYSATYLYAGFPAVFPDGVVWWPVAWGWIEYPLAMMAGSAVYGET